MNGFHRMKQPKLTIVSGYWICPNKHGDKFNDWFERTLRINCPYVFFGTTETIALAKQFRRELPTRYIALNLTEFHTARYRSDFLAHPTHCPSAELNMIWNEKLFLMQRAAHLNPFGSEWFLWADAGICTYRTTPPPLTPFPDIQKLAGLPNNALLYTSSDSPLFQPDRVSDSNYYHFISGTYAIHKDVIDRFVELYGSYLATYVPKRCNIFTDQVILTYMYKDHPKLFHRIGHGYGKLVPLLY